MKRQIRRNVFETNSSSMHAICISKKDVDKANLPEHVTFTHGEFGWEVAEYADLWTKASYLYQAICTCYYHESYEKEATLNRVKEILQDYGISCEFEPDKDPKWGDGYIDHGYDTIDFIKAVLEDGDKLLRYLFGDSFVVTGNDNGYGYEERMYIYEGEEVTDYGTFPIYGDLKPEFANYEIYVKGN